jgi:serine/threonine-protein kinase
MSPEQALGLVDEVDERTDVFALGSILCELLTGAPAYVPEHGHLLLQAARTNLDDAYTRLDACRTDRTLARLARQCLSPDRALRPRDASVVADAVSDHLAGVSRRMREAELAAAEADAQAAAERRRRRLTVRAATRGALLLVGLAAVTILLRHRRTQRIEGDLLAVQGALHDAVDREAEAQGTEGAVALAHYAEAQLEAGRAQALLETVPADAALGREVEAAVTRIAEGAAAARAALAQAKRDRRLRSELQRIRRMQAWRNHAQAVAAYEAAFDHHDVDLDNPASAAAAIRGSPVRADMLYALDEWAYWTRRYDDEG